MKYLVGICLSILGTTVCSAFLDGPKLLVVAVCIGLLSAVFSELVWDKVMR